MSQFARPNLAGLCLGFQVDISLLTYSLNAPSVQWGSDTCKWEEYLEKNDIG